MFSASELIMETMGAAFYHVTMGSYRVMPCKNIQITGVPSAVGQRFSQFSDNVVGLVVPVGVPGNVFLGG